MGWSFAPMATAAFRATVTFTANELKVREAASAAGSGEAVIALAAQQVPIFIETWYSTPADGHGPFIQILGVYIMCQISRRACT